MTGYMVVKHAHILAVGMSLFFFLLRAGWAFYTPERLEQRWIRVLPHCIDTVLLVCGIWLMVQIQQYPFLSSWLTAKVVGLLVYIALGLVVLRFAKSKLYKGVATIVATLVFFYIIGVAHYHTPWSWFVSL